MAINEEVESLEFTVTVTVEVVVHDPFALFLAAAARDAYLVEGSHVTDRLCQTSIEQLMSLLDPAMMTDYLPGVQACAYSIRAGDPDA